MVTFAILGAVWIFAGDVPPPMPAHVESAAELPARHEGDPEAPSLPPVVNRGEQIPAPLPVVTPSEKDERFTLTRDQIVKLSIVPGTAFLSGLVAPIALGARGGDWGTPATEQLAGYGGGYVGAAAAIGLTALVEGTTKVDPRTGVSRPALATAVFALPLLTPAAAGASTWLAGEGMQGRSAHPSQNLLAAMGGGFAGELIFTAAAIAMRQPMGGNAAIVFVPIAVGSTIAYDLARGPHRGPRRAAMPMFAVRF